MLQLVNALSGAFPLYLFHEQRLRLRRELQEVQQACEEERIARQAAWASLAASQ